MTLMRDSVSASRVPPTTPVVAGYADGLYEWSAADWALFPRAIQLTIAVNALHAADILDVENGDATPSDVPGWCDRFARLGRRAPTVYCNLSSWPAVKAAVGARRVDYWIATLNGKPTPGGIAGAVAEQYVQHTDAAFHYDESIIYDESWLTAPLPIPGDDAMTLDLARLIVFGWYTSIRPKSSPTQKEVDYWSTRLTTGENFEAVYTSFLETPEAKAALGR